MTVEPGPATCEEIEELAGAYALDALTEDELSRVEEHLATCANPHPAILDLREAASLLAFAAPTVEPPAGLGQRIAAAAVAESEAPGRRFEGASSRVDRLAPSAPRPPVRSQWHRGPLPLALAAVFALLALGLGWWGFMQHQDLQRQRAETARDAAVLADLSSGSEAVETAPAGSLHPAIIVQPHSGGSAYLLLDWPQAAAGRTYQAWLIPQGQKPVSAGVFSGSRSGFQIVRLTRPISGAQVFAVTLEPLGGSDQPTTQPFIVRQLPSS